MMMIRKMLLQDMDGNASIRQLVEFYHDFYH